MNNNPWELLDIDDFDLPSFVRPTIQSSSSSTRLILGPARVVQAAMMNRQSREPLRTQEFIMRAHQPKVAPRRPRARGLDGSSRGPGGVGLVDPHSGWGATDARGGPMVAC
ncbi:hypothetical protein JHK87_022599 [Glycine soja]|nr:hypothetical protein JHK87_022599 [Glycine soja]